DQFSKDTPGSERFSKTEGDPATALARRASDQLGLNLLEDTELSRFLSHLLDKMTKQSAQIEYLNSKIHQPQQQLDHCLEPPHDSDAQHEQETKKSGNTDPRQISPDFESIYLVSVTLRSTLIKLGDFSPFDGIDEMNAPYIFVYHYRRQLQELAKRRQGDVSHHISLLLSYIESHYREEYDDADTKFAKGVVIQEHLTKLWIPNQVFIYSEKGHHMAYVLYEWPENRLFDIGYKKDLQITGWSWSYDGDKLYRTRISIVINLGSHDEIRIDQLRAYPLKYSTRELRNRLRDRGLKFWNLRGQHLKAYSGLDFHKERTYSHNRFMIDAATYSRLHRGSNWAIGRGHYDLWPETIPRDQQQLSDEELTILPPSTLGFDFQEKEWIRLNVDLIEDIKWNKGAFNQLVLPGKTKELIQALITARISGMQDIISNKGNGLVILLHGGPGTGKTLTAETVAEIAEKPLYPVTCGDIGTNAEEVEKYLSSIFSLGKIWGCVLLLDEADIFLQERSLTDLHRNSIVSVFLRILEYYD
ncbi:MAG: hypothetical protein Q9214_006670, partial [Letrouitia sp. 1 TL-2023]